MGNLSTGLAAMIWELFEALPQTTPIDKVIMKWSTPCIGHYDADWLIIEHSPELQAAMKTKQLLKKIEHNSEPTIISAQEPDGPQRFFNVVINGGFEAAVARVRYQRLQAELALYQQLLEEADQLCGHEPIHYLYRHRDGVLPHILRQIFFIAIERMASKVNHLLIHDEDLADVLENSSINIKHLESALSALQSALPHLSICLVQDAEFYATLSAVDRELADKTRRLFATFLVMTDELRARLNFMISNCQDEMVALLGAFGDEKDNMEAPALHYQEIGKGVYIDQDLLHDLPGEKS